MKTTHWMVRNVYTSGPEQRVLLSETDKSFTYAKGTGNEGRYIAGKITVRKHSHPDMRFFDNELDAIDYLASLIIREQEAARQKMLEWTDRLEQLKQVRVEAETRGAS